MDMYSYFVINHSWLLTKYKSIIILVVYSKQFFFFCCFLQVFLQRLYSIFTVICAVDDGPSYREIRYTENMNCEFCRIGEVVEEYFSVKTCLLHLLMRFRVC